MVIPLSHSLHPLHPSSKLTQPDFHLSLPPTKLKSLCPNHSKQHLRKPKLIHKATENDSQTENESKDNQQQQSSELGTEIKKAMKEKEKAKEDTGGGLLSGVIDEVGKIEWPEFGKVIGTTGVILGVIAGSSVVLLTVNAVLAELSDRVFAGKGVQDFFG